MAAAAAAAQRNKGPGGHGTEGPERTRSSEYVPNIEMFDSAPDDEIQCLFLDKKNLNSEVGFVEDKIGSTTDFILLLGYLRIMICLVVGH